MRENGCILNSILPASTKEAKLRAELEAEFKAKIAKTEAYYKAKIADLLSESADAVRELEGAMKAKLAARIANAKQMLGAMMTTAKETREWAPLAACLETLVVDELRESCGDAVESAKNLLATLRAEEKERKAAVSVYVC